MLQNESAVLGLLDRGRLPFPGRAPKYIRARLYTYHFTDEFRTKDWWWRELKQVSESRKFMNLRAQPLLFNLSSYEYNLTVFLLALYVAW